MLVILFVSGEVVCSIADGYHFILIKVNIHSKVITVYDSFYNDKVGADRTFTKTIKLLNNLEDMANKGTMNVQYNWNAAVKGISGVPQQSDKFSCGFFVLMFLELRARDLPFEYLEEMLSGKSRTLPLPFHKRRLVHNMIRGRVYIFEPSHAGDYNN